MTAAGIAKTPQAQVRRGRTARGKASTLRYNQRPSLYKQKNVDKLEKCEFVYILRANSI